MAFIKFTAHPDNPLGGDLFCREESIEAVQPLKGGGSVLWTPENTYRVAEEPDIVFMAIGQSRAQNSNELVTARMPDGPTLQE